jgi:iron complex transport system permease protein
MKSAIAIVLLVAIVHLLTPWTSLAEAARVDPQLARLVLVELRLPRTLLALAYGAALGISGAALQAVFANPLASPDISGASSGAALGAVLGGYWLGATSPLALTVFGATGALLALLLLFALAGKRGDSATLLLAGLAISLALGAATSLALALAPSPFAFYDALDWLMGSFVDRSLGQALAAVVPATVAGLLLIRRRGAFDQLALGEDVAASLGLQPSRLARETLLLSAIAVGACVAVCGAIGFIGLAAPFIARRVSAGLPGSALPPAAIIGAGLMLLSDFVVRDLPLNRPLPVGVVTAIAGTPLLLWLITSMRRRWTA